MKVDQGCTVENFKFLSTTKRGRHPEGAAAPPRPAAVVDSAASSDLTVDEEFTEYGHDDCPDFIEALSTTLHAAGSLKARFL
jgi:hypothetical protein